MSELEAALQWIAGIERENFGKSAYEIANILRGYTKPAYTTPAWTAATGYKQGFVEGKLNQDVVLAGEVTDLGHLIAALSDQINQPGFKLSDLTSWTADHTAWAGDIGSAIATYRSQTGNSTLQSLHDALFRLASSSDYAADIAASVMGTMINSGSQTPISQLISQYNSKPYSDHIKTFISNRFRVTIIGNKLQKPEKVEAEIRRSVSTYLELATDVGILKAAKKVLSFQPKLEPEFKRLSIGTDLLQGSLHFLNYLVQKGELAPLKFHPYQLPQAPWLGTVNYEVSVPS